MRTRGSYRRYVARPKHQLILFAQPVDPAPPERRLEGFQKFLATPLGAALITLLFSTIAGGLITNYFADRQHRATEYKQRVAASEAARRVLLESFARTVSERRLAVGLVRSSLEAQARPDELRERWVRYQAAYMAYNVGDFALKNAMLEFLGGSTFELFKKTADHSLLNSFGRIDRCLSSAYRQSQKGRPISAARGLQHCRSVLPTTPLDHPSSAQRHPREWQLTGEVTLLQSCIATFETQLMYAIYLENRFDRLEEANRNVDTVLVLLPPDNKDHKLTLDQAGKTSPSARCKSESDWVCQRLLARGRIKEQLSAPDCSYLADSKNYFDTLQPHHTYPLPPRS